MWLTGWDYRKKITITGQTGASTNYQIKLLIGESSGATGENFDVEDNSASFPSDKNISGDLRFTAADGETLLPFWIESVSGSTPNRLATVHIKVSADLDSNQDIYCYYGGDTTNVSNGDNTFLLFDDFEGSSLDTEKWEQIDCGATGTRNTSVGSSVLSFSCKSNNFSDALRAIQSIDSFDLDGIELVSYHRFPNWGGLGSLGYYRVGTIALSTLTSCSWSVSGAYSQAWEAGHKMVHNSGPDTTWTESSDFSSSDNPTQYRRRSFSIKSNVKYFKENTELYTSSSDIPTSSQKLLMRAGNWGSSYPAGAVDVDYIFLKKFIDTEPTFNTASSEEVNVSNTSDFFQLF